MQFINRRYLKINTLLDKKANGIWIKASYSQYIKVQYSKEKFLNKKIDLL